MPRLTMETSHALGQEEAVRRLKKKLSALTDIYQSRVNDLQKEWNGNRFSFGFKAAGMKVAGALTVEDAEVKLDAKLPLAAMIFKGKIEERVREELGKLLV